MTFTGAEFTKRMEGCKLTAYADSGGVWTIGVGHTGPEVHEGLTWTQEQADAALLGDIQHAVDCVNRAVIGKLTQNQFDALVDFTYNVGCHAFMSSTLLHHVNLGNFMLAAAQFKVWIHAGGKVVEGLVNRRIAERDLFLSGDTVLEVVA